MAVSAQRLRDERVASAQEAKGFVALPLRVVFDPSLSAVDLRVLATIAGHDWGNQSAGCLLPYARIAELSATSESSVKRSIKTLEALRYIHQPIAKTNGGRRASTTIRVTNRVRVDGFARPEVVADIPPAAEQAELDGFNVDPSDKKKRVAHGSSVTPSRSRGSVQAEPADGSSVTPIINKQIDQQQPGRVVAQKFRPDLEREPLTADDTGRLRCLDALGCSESEDWLGLLLGAIAQRERSLGRRPSPGRFRAVLDGVLAKRQVARADNPLGFMLAGIERGFLIANPQRDGSNLDPSSFYELELPERARAVVAVAQGRAHGIPREVVRVVQRLLAERPGLAGRVESGETGELEP